MRTIATVLLAVSGLFAPVRGHAQPEPSFFPLSMVGELSGQFFRGCSSFSCHTVEVQSGYFLDFPRSPHAYASILRWRSWDEWLAPGAFDGPNITHVATYGGAHTIYPDGSFVPWVALNWAHPVCMSFASPCTGTVFYDGLRTWDGNAYRWDDGYINFFDDYRPLWFEVNVTNDGQSFERVTLARASAASSVAVPEPGSLALLLTVGAVVSLRARRKA